MSRDKIIQIDVIVVNITKVIRNVKVLKRSS